MQLDSRKIECYILTIFYGNLSMLQQIYQKTKGWFAWIIFTLITVTFIFCGIEFRAKNQSKIIFQIGKKQLTAETFQKKLEQYKASLMHQNKGLVWNPETEQQIAQTLFNEIVENARLAHTIEQMHLVIPDEQFLNEIAKIPDFQQNGKFALPLFQQYLAANHLSQEQFKQLFWVNLGLTQQKAGIEDTEFLLPYEEQCLQTAWNQQRLVKIADLSKIKEVEQKIPEQDQKRYYQTHQNDFLDQAQVKFEYLILDIHDLPRQKFNEKELQRFYEEHINYYTSPKRWQVLLVQLHRTPVESQEKTAVKIAKLRLELSETNQIQEDFHTKTEIVWLTDGSFEGKLKDVLETAKVGEILPEINDENSIVLVKVLAIEAQKIRSFDEVHQQIAMTLEQQTLNEIFHQKADQLAELVYNNPEDLTITAQTLHLALQQNPWSTYAELLKRFNVLVARKAFEPMMLQQHVNSDLIELSPGKLIVFKVHDHIPAQPLPFKVVQPQILKIMQAEQTATRRKQIAQDLMHQEQKLSKVLKDQYQISLDNEIFNQKNSNEPLGKIVFTKMHLIQNRLFFEDPWFLILEKQSTNTNNDEDWSHIRRIFRATTLENLKTTLYKQQKIIKQYEKTE